MKLIDLLSALYRVNNGSKEMIPKKIKCRSTEFNFDKKYNRYVNYNGKTIGELIPLDIFLDEEAEIIEEEKEIEKIKSNGIDFYNDCINVWISKEETVAYCEFLMNKVNELIDAVNSINKGK